MDYAKDLLKKHSKEHVQEAADFIGESQERFDELMGYVFSKNKRMAQRASWIMTTVLEQYPHLVEPHFDTLVNNLTKPDLSSAIKRNTVRYLQDADIPEKWMGIVADCCFGFLADPREAVAVRVFSMSVLLNLCRSEPDLGIELKELIEQHFEHGTPGFKSRGSKVLRELKKMRQQM